MKPGDICIIRSLCRCGINACVGRWEGRVVELVGEGEPWEPSNRHGPRWWVVRQDPVIRVAECVLQRIDDGQLLESYLKKEELDHLVVKFWAGHVIP